MEALPEWFEFAGDVIQNKPKTFDTDGGMYESINYASFCITEALLLRLAWLNSHPGSKLEEIPQMELLPAFFSHVAYPRTGQLHSISLVAGLAEVQEALGPDGYLSAYPEELINRNLKGKSVWAPWYTLHKIMSGLIDQYLYSDNQQALEVATKMGNWAYKKHINQPEETRKLMLRNEFGGMNEAFYNLYSVTGDSKFRELAEYFYHDDVINPLKAGDTDFGKKHTNTFIPKVIGEARNYELTSNEEAGKVARLFWMRWLASTHS